MGRSAVPVPVPWFRSAMGQGVAVPVPGWGSTTGQDAGSVPFPFPLGS